MTESKGLRPAAGTAGTEKAPGASGTRNAVFLPCTSGVPDTRPGAARRRTAVSLAMRRN